MTNEEAIDELSVIWERLSHPENCEQGVYSFRDGDYLEALDLAIKALEQQPCEDCISREAVKEMLTEEWTKYMPMEMDVNLSFVLEKINEIPSVTPQPNIGHWILDETDNSITCSKCNCLIWANDIINGEPYYCPTCGRKMEAEE